MSKTELKHELKLELKKVNKIIDYKIVRGLPYAREARAHKLLLARLAIINKTSWLARSMRVASFFLF